MRLLLFDARLVLRLPALRAVAEFRYLHVPIFPIEVLCAFSKFIHIALPALV